MDLTLSMTTNELRNVTHATRSRRVGRNSDSAVNKDLGLKAKAKDSRYQEFKIKFYRSSCIVFLLLKCCGCFYVRILFFSVNCILSVYNTVNVL